MSGLQKVLLTQKNINHIFIVIFFVLNSSSIAQTIIKNQYISESSINIRGSAHTVAEVIMDIPDSGIVMLRFDGYCISDVGDRIVLAANNRRDWDPNYGCISVEALSDSNQFNTFSHTRCYPVSKGQFVAYAIAENTIKRNGSGLASIYGDLSVTYYPGGNNPFMIKFQEICETNIYVRGAPVSVGNLTLNITVPGKVVVHFDGICYADVGDMIVIAASDENDWEINDGCVNIESISAEVRKRAFSHTRVYQVQPGCNDFFAVVENVIKTDGNGVASIYGNFVAEFFPDSSSHGKIFNQSINETSINVRGNPVIVGEIVIDDALSGKVLVNFDGQCNSDVGDIIVLAASNDSDWSINYGNVSLQAVNSVKNSNMFSHSMVFTKPSGTCQFFAVVENVIKQDGQGNMSIYGSLTAKYFSGSNTEIKPENDYIGSEIKLLKNYPNPFNAVTTIQYSIPEISHVSLTVTNIKGREVVELFEGIEQAGTHTLVWDASNLPSGVYFIQMRSGSFTSLKKCMLIK